MGVEAAAHGAVQAADGVDVGERVVVGHLDHNVCHGLPDLCVCVRVLVSG